jgi:hypothetical protein
MPPLRGWSGGGFGPRTWLRRFFNSDSKSTINSKFKSKIKNKVKGSGQSLP